MSCVNLPRTVLTVMMLGTIAGLLINVSHSDSPKEKEETNKQLSVLLKTVIIPIAEEILFRGVLQNGISLVQKITKYALSKASLDDNRVVEWLTSPALRTSATGFIFGAGHITNATSFNSLYFATIVAINHSYDCGFSILYETTGSLLPSIAAHITTNSILNHEEIYNAFLAS